MGEIADAIRRARNQLPGQRLLTPDPAAEPAPTLRSLSPSPAPAAPVREPERKPAFAVDSVDPENEAIILEDGPNAEACRHLALRLRSALDAQGARSVALVSAERGDGKTTVACDLAIALATLSRERDVALVDLDLRKPSIAKYLSIPHDVGIEEVLLGRASLDSVRVQVHLPAIDVFPVVTAQRAAHELIVLPRMAQLIEELERRYTTVIVDTPPAPLVPDANLILRHVPACVPVVRSGKTRARSVRRLMDCLPDDRILGWVLNCAPRSAFGYQDYYYGEGELEPESRWRFWRGKRGGRVG